MSLCGSEIKAKQIQKDSNRERVRDWEERMVGHRSVPPTNFIRALAFVLFLSNPPN